MSSMTETEAQPESEQTAVDIQPTDKVRKSPGVYKHHDRKKMLFNQKNTGGHQITPQAYEQVGEYHVLQARVLAGSASEKERNQFFVLDYENSVFVLADLKEQDEAGTIRWPLKDDIPYYEKFIAENKEKYEKLRIEIMPKKKREAYERSRRNANKDNPDTLDSTQG